MNDVNRKVGGVLVGVGGLTAAVALLCCVAPWLLAGFLVALGLGFLLKDVLLLAIAAGCAGGAFRFLVETKTREAVAQTVSLRDCEMSQTWQKEERQ